MQLIVISHQLRIILYSVIFGCFFGLFYDIIKLVREFFLSEWQKGFLRKAIELFCIHILDFLYMLILAVSFCIFVFYYNSGIVRWYFLLACFVGFVIYRYSIGIPVRFLLLKCVWLVKRLLYFVILVPVKALTRLFIKLTAPLFAELKYKRNIRNTERIKKQIISNLEFNYTGG